MASLIHLGLWSKKQNEKKLEKLGKTPSIHQIQGQSKQAEAEVVPSSSSVKVKLC